MHYQKLLTWLTVIVLGCSFVVPGTTRAATSTPPQGWLDSCVSGWVLDPNTPSESLSVHIYVDKPAGVDGNSGFVASVKSTVVREDVNKVFNRPAGEAHGFNWTPLKSLYDGQAHKVYAYGIDSTDLEGRSNSLLNGSPKECTWSGTGGTSGAVVVTNPFQNEQWQVGTTHKITWADALGVSRAFTYSLYLEPYIACLYLYPTPCKIAERAPYIIAEHVTGESFTWTIPTGLPSDYITTSRIRVKIDTTDLSGVSEVFSVVPSQAELPVSITGPLLSFMFGVRAEAEFKVTGGSGKGFVWTLNSGTLPPGLVLGSPDVLNACDAVVGQRESCGDNTATRLLSGTPTAIGTYNFVLKATDSAGKWDIASFTATVSPSGPNPIFITPPTVLSATVGQVYSGMFSVTGGTAPYSWNLSGPSASGLSLKDITFNCITTPCVPPKTEVIVSGTPVTVGSFVFNISVTDSTGKVATTQFTVNVLAASDKTIRTDNVDVASPLFVSNPKSGEVLKAGYTTNILWNVLADTQGLPVTIKYNYVNNPPCLKLTPACALPSTQESVVIASSAPNTGTYAWSIPSTLNGEYWVTVSMGGWSDDSDVFTVQGDVKSVGLLPGQIVKSSTGNTLHYITSSGAKYGFSSLSDFTSRGFSLRSIESVSQSVLDSTPTTLIFSRVSGASFKYSSTNTVYYLNSKYCKEGYLGYASIRSWSVDFSAVYNIPTSEQYPDCTPAFVQFKDNTIVRLENNPTIYKSTGLVLRPFVSFNAFTNAGFTTRDILLMNQAEKGLYTIGEPIN